jgi:Mn2+/Fe2+ NRAMP family transporter
MPDPPEVASRTRCCESSTPAPTANPARGIEGFIAHSDAGRLLVASVVPHVELSKEYIAAIVAVFGTTISPYLFFWQASSEVDEMRAAGKLGEKQRRGVRRAELSDARIDIAVGMFINGLVAPPLMVLIVLLGSSREVMGGRVSGALSKTLCWIATGIMAVAAVALLVTQL